MKTKSILLCVLLFCVFLKSAVASETSLGAFDKGVLVSTAWLQARLYQPGVVVVHVQGAFGDSYEGGHIPGARFVSNGQLGVVRGNVAGMLPSLDTFIELARTLGIDEETKKVVIYGPDPFGPARLSQAFDYLGLKDRTALLDGQFPKWIAEGRPTTGEVPPAVYTGFVPGVNPGTLITRSSIGDLMSTVALRRTENPDLDTYGFVLFDIRPSVQYELGHIPGAVQADALADFEGGDFSGRIHRRSGSFETVRNWSADIEAWAWTPVTWRLRPVEKAWMAHSSTSF